MSDQLYVPVVLLPEDAHRTGSCMGHTVSMDIVGSRMPARSVRCLFTTPILLLLLLLLLLLSSSSSSSSSSMALQPSADYGLLVTRGFVITHNDALQSVALLWTSDQLVAETLLLLLFNSLTLENMHLCCCFVTSCFHMSVKSYH
jgi:hypothetical protein